MKLHEKLNLINDVLTLPILGDMLRAAAYRHGVVSQLSIKKNLPANLARLIALRGVAKRDLASKLGVSPATISNWLGGQALPELWRLDDIAKALETDVVELVRHTDYNADTDTIIRLLQDVSAQFGFEIKKKPDDK